MNRLQLVQRLHSEIARGSTLAGSQPTSSEGQTGKNLQLVNWIDRAWQHIQNKHRFWRWAMGYGQATLEADKFRFNLAVLIADFRNWVPFYYQGDTRPYLFLQPSDQTSSPVRIRYRSQGTLIHENHLLGFALSEPADVALLNTGRPAEFTFLDNETSIIFPVKLEVEMQLAIRYQMTAQVMDENADEPTMPSDHHMAIVYKAAQYWAKFEGDFSTAGSFKSLYNEAFHDLVVDQLSGGPNLPGEDRD